MKSFIKGGLFGGAIILFSFVFSFALWDSCTLSFCTNYIHYSNPVLDTVLKVIFYTGFVLGFLLTLPGRILIMINIPVLDSSLAHILNLTDSNFFSYFNSNGWIFLFILYFVIGGLIGLILRKQNNQKNQKEEGDIDKIISSL